MSPPTPSEPATIVDSEATLHELLDVLEGERVVAADTESNSMHAYTERVCLLQLTFADRDWLIDPFEVDLAPLAKLFARPEQEVIFHAAEYDVMCLRRDYGFEFTELFDTMIAARILGWKAFGLGSILGEHFGVTLDKKLQRYDWGSRPLSQAALDYARLDTHFLHRLREIQLGDLEEAGRMDEARAAFARVAKSVATEKVFDPEGFWKIKGASELSPEQASALRALYQWREQLAKGRDRPLFKVLGGKTMLLLAARRPTHISQLRSIQGLSPHLVRREGSKLLEVIERSRDEEPPQRPKRGKRAPKTPADLRFEELRAWRKAVADERGVEYDVILTKRTMLDLAALEELSAKQLEQAQILDAWQLQTYGDDVLRVLKKTP